MASSISFWRVLVSVHSSFWRVFEKNDFPHCICIFFISINAVLEFFCTNTVHCNKWTKLKKKLPYFLYISIEIKINLISIFFKIWIIWWQACWISGNKVHIVIISYFWILLKFGKYSFIHIDDSKQMLYVGNKSLLVLVLLSSWLSWHCLWYCLW